MKNELIERFQRESIEIKIETNQNLYNQYVNFILKDVNDYNDNNVLSIINRNYLLQDDNATNGIIIIPLDANDTNLLATDYKWMIQLTDINGLSSQVLDYGILRVLDNYYKSDLNGTGNIGNSGVGRIETNQWLSSNIDPDSTIGNNNDFLLNTISKDVFKKTDNIWSKITNLNGIDGINGLSAYQIWLSQRNTGTEQDFLNSLVGVPGNTGLSAYQIWINNGNIGNETDFLNSLIGINGINGINGTNGLSAYQIWINNGNIGTETDFLNSLIGISGNDGINGSKWFNGSINPVTVTDSLNGDYYLNTVTGDVFQKISNEWNLICNLIGPSGGGSGSGTLNNIGSNIVQSGTLLTSVYTDFGGYTYAGCISGTDIFNTPSIFNLTISFQNTQAINIDGIQIKKTLLNNSTIISSTDIKIGGSLTPSITPSSGSIFSVDTDDIELTLDNKHDYWIYISFNSSSGTNLNCGTFSNSKILGSWQTGNRLTDITVGFVKTNAYFFQGATVKSNGVNVTSYNSLTNKPSLSNYLVNSNIKAGANITVSTSGNDVTINSTGGGSSQFNIDSNGNILGSNNYNITSGINNTVLATNTSSSNISGDENIILGYRAGLNFTSASSNVLIGNMTSQWNSINYSIAIGNNSLAHGADYNIGIGYYSLNNVTTQNNIGIGTFALSYLRYSNCIGLGNYVTVTGDNQVQIGDTSQTVYTQSAIQNRSDERDKAEIQPCDLGLDFILKVKPIKYKHDFRENYEVFVLDEKGNKTFDKNGSPIKETLPKDGSKMGSRFHYGLGAAQVKQVLDELGIDASFYQDHSVNGGKDVKSLAYNGTIPALILSIHQHNDIIIKQQQQIDELKSLILDLQNKIYKV